MSGILESPARINGRPLPGHGPLILYAPNTILGLYFGIASCQNVHMILRTEFPPTFLDTIFNVLAWLLTNAPYLTIFGGLFVLLLLTQPPEFWAALRRVPCPECGRKQPLPPPKGAPCPGCGVRLTPTT